MRKAFLTVLTALILGSVLALSACGETPTEPTETKGTEVAPTEAQSSQENPTETATQGGFQVGFSRVDLTPDEPLPLSGYGNNDQRVSNGFLNDIATTCVALKDENETILYFTTDMCYSSQFLTDIIWKQVSQATGVPKSNIILTYTHTHSSVDQDLRGQFPAVDRWLKKYEDGSVKAATEAIANCEPATMFWGECDLTGFNFVRHYWTTADEAIGDNHGTLDMKGVVNRHITEANHIMQMVLFKRSKDKDVLLTNWRAHATLTGGSAELQVSSDFVGVMRRQVEKSMGVYCAYFQGDCGNINPRSRLAGEEITEDYREYGKLMAERIEAAAKNMEEIQVGPVKVSESVFTGKVRHDDSDCVTKAQEIMKIWTVDNDRPGADRLCSEYGFESVHDAMHTTYRATYGATFDLNCHAVSIGDFTICVTPIEMFDTTGDYIRANSPTKYTFVSGYAEMYGGYIPSQYGYEYGCYESDTAKFVAGTAELLADFMLDLMKTTNAK